MRRAILNLSVAVFITTAAWAQGSEWQIDPAHTTVGLTSATWACNVHGRFTRVIGLATIDDRDVTKSSVNATDVASINTGNDGRDNDLRSPNYSMRHNSQI